tara:strand:+ start:143 stop:700 length:558 start_codon:yes stop_codon:yes gene_type:complete
MYKFILFSLIITPFFAKSQEFKSSLFIHANIGVLHDSDDDINSDYDFANNLSFGIFINENFVVGLSTHDAMSTTDNNRYVKPYRLSSSQIFSTYFFVKNKTTPFITLKKPLKFNDEFYQAYNTDNVIVQELQSFDFLNNLYIGCGVSHEIKKNVFFDISYIKLIKKNLYGLKNGSLAFGVSLLLF